MKFSTAIQGTRAEKLVEYPGHDTVKLALRPLTGAEVSQSYTLAADYARERKESPETPLFRLAQMAAVLSIACLDHESTPRTPFFDGGFDQVMGLDYEVIAYLYEHHERWQTACSPYTTNLPFSELVSLIDTEVAQSDDRFFMRLAPNMRWNFVHILASLVASSQEARSHALWLASEHGADSNEAPWTAKSDPA